MIRFSKFIWLYLSISACVIIPGIFSMFRWGFRQSVDFTGGTMVELKLTKDIGKDTLSRTVKDSGLTVVSIQPAGPSKYLIRFPSATDSQLTGLLRGLNEKDGTKAEILRNDTVGPVIGKELFGKAVTAAIAAMIVILLYVAYAFKNVKFGVSAIIALIHDILVVCGSFALLGHFRGVEVDTLFVTAFLTTMSFSVHDTIVIFDRIREYRRHDIKTPFGVLCDMALTETIGRSLVNSFTIIFMLLALVLMGGETVRWFAVALLIGTVTGTYSSPFIATPALILWDRYEHRKRK